MTERAIGKESLDRSGLRVPRFLARGDADEREAAMSGRVLLDCGNNGVVGASADDLHRLASGGLVVLKAGRAALSQTGRDAAKPAAAPADPFGIQQQERGNAIVMTTAGEEVVTVNHAESPLGMLLRRKGKDGSAFLTAREYRAGERLRIDYSRGCIMPRMGVNWGAAAGGGRKLGEVNGIADRTDVALAARQRVEKAVAAVGPELAGVLIDVCCFLKGLERVEAERLWPARSAKVVLKSALSALARHYDPQRAVPGGRAPILHWGSEDYRPRIT